MTPDTPVTQVPFVKPSHATRMAKLGILTVRDLLYHLPRRWEDTRRVLSIAEVLPGPEPQTVRATVRSVSQRTGRRARDQKKIVIVEASFVDDGHEALAVWFNQPFLRAALRSGMEVLLSGRVRTARNGRPEFQSPRWEPVGEREQRHVGRLTPVYPETDKLSSKFLRERIVPLLGLASSLPDLLPPEVREREQLLPIGAALHQVHFPDDEESRRRGVERVAFEEHFVLQLAAERARRRRLRSDGVTVPYDVEVARAYTAALPFALTRGQRRAAHEILTDLAAPGYMNRLLQGDVGSGKTAVAAMASLMTVRAGMQVAVMAPTEILARQHLDTFTTLLAAHDVAPRLLVGSTPGRARAEVTEAMAEGRESLLIGTHALIEDDVAFRALGLVIVDEQHRFGVVHRQRLRRKAAAMPNFLAMTATPIPRSLSLTLYGDVNVSELREMPPGRTPVATRVVPPHRRAEAYAFIREQVRQGRQAFVICPLIEESDKLGVRSATAEYERLRADVFSDLRVELLHGRMPSREKEERMARFAAGGADLLVATSVIEVGVDVPNATIMVVEGAERFGMAQLHQFRGRVGRGAHRGYCLLFEGGGEDDETAQRLETVASTSSGFELAESDLRLRGAGDVAGLRQHGLPEMRAADLLDVAMIQRARAAAQAWLDRDPELVAYAPLHEAMNGYRAVFDLD